MQCETANTRFLFRRSTIRRLEIRGFLGLRLASFSEWLGSKAAGNTDQRMSLRYNQGCIIRTSDRSTHQQEGIKRPAFPS